VDERIGELPLGVRDMDAFPFLDVVHAADQLVATPTERDELDVGGIELGELGVGGESRIEDKRGLNTPANLAPV